MNTINVLISSDHYSVSIGYIHFYILHIQILYHINYNLQKIVHTFIKLINKNIIYMYVNYTVCVYIYILTYSIYQTTLALVKWDLIAGISPGWRWNFFKVSFLTYHPDGMSTSMIAAPLCGARSVLNHLQLVRLMFIY